MAHAGSWPLALGSFWRLPKSSGYPDSKWVVLIHFAMTEKSAVVAGLDLGAAGSPWQRASHSATAYPYLALNFYEMMYVSVR